MKTKNNTQKTAFSALAAFGLIILGFSVSAQFATTSLIAHNEAPQIAMAIDNTAYSLSTGKTNTVDFENANTFAEYLAVENDEPLHIEEWMTEENNFSKSYGLESEADKSLQIEEWMTDETTFDAYSMILEVETEAPMNLEEWMMDDETFCNYGNEIKAEEIQNDPWSISTKTFFYREVNQEEKLKLETWMFNQKIWNN
jgi:hypothetical protein